MKLFRFLAVAALAMFAGANAQAGVVLSNLGNDGLTANVGGGQFSVTTTDRYAIGFTTGSSSVNVTGVTAMLDRAGGPESVAVKFGIYTSVGDNPGVLVGSASADGLVTTTTSIVPFDFTGSNVTLSASTKYWAVITTPLSASQTIRWFNTDPIAAPSAVGGSGFSSSLIDIRQSTNSGSTWTQGGVLGVGFSLSGTAAGAVPEPALTSLLCLGGVALIRRRMKK